MAKKAFSIADYLSPSEVSSTDTPAEQIIRVPLGRLRENKLNFYDTSDIQELTASIELNGLIEPLIVLEEPEHPGCYRIISGHRRYKALSALAADDPDRWANVPVIVRNPEDAVTEELLLIEANRATRVMSSADTMHQAERYKELLVKLKERGVQIPGRLRNAVAEAMQISATRLARLDVIRKNLIPAWMERFESGALAETAAYELARCKRDVQELMTIGLKTSTLTAERVADLKGYAMECLKSHACAVDPAEKCSHGTAMWVEGKGKPYWSRCVPGHYSSAGKCCADCRDYEECSHACPRAADEVKARRAEDRAQYEAQHAEEERERTAQVNAAARQWHKIIENLQSAGVPSADIAAAFGLAEETLGRYVAGDVPRYCPSPDDFGVSRLLALSEASGLTVNEILGQPGGCRSAEHVGAWPEPRDPETDPPPVGKEVLVIDRSGRYEVDSCYKQGTFLYVEAPERWWPLPPEPSGDMDDAGKG